MQKCIAYDVIFSIYLIGVANFANLPGGRRRAR